MADAPFPSVWPPPGVPRAFTSVAYQRGVMDYTPAVVEMTHRIYPGRAIRYGVEEDIDAPEELQWIMVFKVDVNGLSADELAETQRRWCQEIFHHCPPAGVSAFRLLWVTS